MKTIRLAEYANEGKLTEIDDAVFFAGKFGPQDQLDFSGVQSVGADYLAVLLGAHTVESLDGRIVGAVGSVDQALAEWAARQNSTGRIEKDRPNPQKSAVSEKPKRRTLPVLEFKRKLLEGDRFTPTRLASRLKNQLTGYIESAYPLNDPILVRARRRLLSEASGGHLLAQEPYVETTPRYKTYDGDYNSLGLKTNLADLFTKLAKTQRQYSDADNPTTLLYPTIYTHQADAFRRFLVEGKDIIVGTGTGSGKTECFLVPMLAMLYDEARSRPDSFQMPGVRALILYPMNALVNDQLTRLRLLFGDTNLSQLFPPGNRRRHPLFGMYTGRTPYPGPRDAGRDGERVRPLMDYYLEMDSELRAELRRLGRHPAKDLESFYAKHLAVKAQYKSGKKEGKSYTQHNWDRRLHTSRDDRELLTRQEMVHGAGTNPGHAPDILITNYSMLEYMLMRPFERPIFRETSEWLSKEGNQFLLVLDEAHMYRGAKGAEVGFLLRRLRARLGINDRPDKLRVICTSASLGADDETVKNILKFAADLTGKAPDDFKAITGERAIPIEVATGDADLAAILSSIDLQHLHATADPDSLKRALTPLLVHLGKPLGPDTTEDAILAHLYAVLNGHPVVNLMLKETAGSARSLKSLATKLFPTHANGIKAIEVLITLGTIARLHKDEPGLIPTRVHSMFRGLHALYACTNPKCSGRQDAPGESAVLGKLFAVPRITCDACDSRVFELASCRYCGSTYLFAFSDRSVANLDFLWGETEGDLNKVELLTHPPRYQNVTEEVRVHLRTGYLDQENTFPENEVRSLWLSLTPDGHRQEGFDRCATCQSPSSRQKSRISDFRTKGEQPFTALIEAQFSEQPPQKNDPRLPNQGRKVLVFSDGRQKAARLAPALEHSHARDLFRQVTALAAHELWHQMQLTNMFSLYPAVLWVCRERGFNLFPAADETEFQGHIHRAKNKTLQELVGATHQGLFRPTKSYAQQLFSEMTDKYYSLNALALATIEEDPAVRVLFNGFPKVGLDENDVLVLFHSWIRLQLEARRFLPPGADISNLGEGWERPDGIDANNTTHILPGAFGEYLQCILGQEEKCSLVENWLREFVRESGFLKFEGDRYFLQPDTLALILRLDDGWFRCKDCGRMYADSLNDCCPACLGIIVQSDVDYLDARTGYYREQLRRAFDGTTHEPFGLLSAEHSAQLTGREDQDAFNKTERYELRFQDIPIRDTQTGHILPPIDVLSCTTTMEVGIDIGTLSGVALRNVPPHVSNYQQRAGRAGRRGRSVASVITYAHGTSHDAQFYEDPSRIISGDVLAPAVYIENQKVLRRHINAYLVQRFFHETVAAGSEIYQLFESLGTVEQFLSNQYPCSLDNLLRWLHTNEAHLLQELRHWVPDYSYGRDTHIQAVDGTINGAIDQLIEFLRHNLPITDFAIRDQLEGLRREGLERQLEQPLLDALIERAIFPRYAFPMDVVGFWVSKLKWKGDPPHKRIFDYEPQRDLQIALSEYAPGSSLTIDKWRFKSDGIYSPYEPEVGPTLERAQAYVACKSCGYVSLQEESEALTVCPCCGHDEMFKHRFITPAGFTADINLKREVDRGQGPSFAGQTTRAQLEVQDPPTAWDAHYFDNRLAVVAGPKILVTVNKGVGDRGFMICPDCGRTEPQFGPGFPNSIMMRGGKPSRHHNPLEGGVFCDGHPVGPYYLGHRFPTDVLLMRVRLAAPVSCAIADSANGSGRPGRAALTSLVEAISLAGSRILQIEEGEMSGNWSPVPGGASNDVYMFLYDLLPGGAGYTKLVKDNLENVLAEAENLLTTCDCETSCYRCLRHYGNNFYHGSLDRRLALALLQYARHGKRPSLTNDECQSALSSLIELVRLKNLRSVVNSQRNGSVIPLVVSREDGTDVWVDVHHPLVNGRLASSSVRNAAEAEFAEFVSLDAFTLRHDLPGAYKALQL